MINRIFAILLVFLSVCRAEPSLEELLKTQLGKLTKEELPGMAVLVAREGKIVFQGGFGFADLAKKTVITPETKFRIGSVTKQFIGAAVLRLVEDGKLALDDTLAKFYPGFPGGAEITVFQLLTHTSGIHSYTGKADFLKRVTERIEPSDLIAWFRDDKPDFAPGRGFLYNNSAYFLAGEIVAKASGQSLDAYLRTTFFDPLGMKNTGLFQNAAPPPGMALGYSILQEKPEPALDWDMSWAGGAGALYSTVGDLFLWNEALFSGKILKPESFRQMTTPVPLPDGVDGMSYGFGLIITPVHRLPCFSHGGGLNGWSSELLQFPEQKCTVVTLANALPPVSGFEPGMVSQRIVAKFLETEINAIPAAKENSAVDKSKYSDFTGRYDYKFAVLKVTVENGRLMARLTGQENYEIFPADNDEFFWKVTDAKVTFLRDQTGRVIAARHTQGGNSFQAPRITETEGTSTVAELDAILGDYDYGGGATLTVTRDGETVFAQLTGQPKCIIHPKSATEFEWRVVPANVRFTKDKDGRITGAVHSQGGATINAPKIR